MKRLTAGLALIIALLPAYASSRGAADRLIEKYKTASGKHAAEFKSLTMTGSATVADGGAGKFSLLAQAPDRIRIDLDTAQQKFSECYNGKSAWLKDEQGLRTLLGREAANLRLLGLILNQRLRDLSKNKIVVDSTGSGAISLTLSQAKTTLNFDATTNLITTIDRGTLDPLPRIAFASYRQVDRAMEPYSLTIGDADSAITVTIETVQHDSAVDATGFEFPEVSGRPLPDVDAIMKSVVANQEKVEQLQEQYTFREIQTEKVLDGAGRTKETHEKVFEVTPVDGRLVRRMTVENGKPLSPSDQEKEDKRVQKEVQDILKRHEKREGEKDKREENQRVTILSFLKSTDVTSVRWESLGGKDVIAFDFEPKPGFKASSRSESLISKLAGTLWVDPDARQVARLQAHFVGSFKVGGGLLASVGSATAFVFEQKNVDGAVWLPFYLEANISARVMLLARFNRAFTTQYSDYKKYQVNSDYKLKNPQAEKSKTP